MSVRGSVSRIGLLTAWVVFVSASLSAQTPPCPAAAAHSLPAAVEAYAQGRYDAAESLYMQALLQKPGDVELSAALARTQLREGKIADAAARAQKLVEGNPNSAAALTALAEVQYRQGLPWTSMQTLNDAAKLDNCYARAHLVRSEILRLDSMYASERKELQIAYDIDPADPDIKREWLQVDSHANDIEGIRKSLATMSNIDADLREKAMASVHGMMSQLIENSQTCEAAPLASPLTLPLIPVLQDARHVSEYQLEVQLPQKKAKLIVDTAASGLYISRALADELALQHAGGDPPDTVRAENVQIGPLQFRNCMIGVSDAPFPDKADGFIGTDIFAPYLITLNFANAKLELAPLPQTAGSGSDALPMDRFIAPEMSSYTPVYHRHQFLLLPVTLNNRERRLFLLDSGMRMTAMAPDVAHLVSSTKVNFTNAMQTVSGGTVQVYRDGFDFQFAGFSLQNQGHILEFSPAAIDDSAGFQIAGLIGFDILHAFTLHIDYRDGLVGFDANAPVGKATPLLAAASAVPSASCDRYVNQSGDLPTSETIEAQIIGSIDSSRAKAGQPISLKVVHEWIGEACRLPAGSMLYGHVLASSGNKAGGELAIAFDRGDCFARPGSQLSLRIIGVVGPPGERKALHDAMPTEIRGVRQISDTVASMGLKEDDNLNPGGPPRTVHPGIVVGLEGLKMTPEGGPRCSALLTSQKGSVRLDLGSEIILAMENSMP